jgi:hypothetical protein
VFLPDLSHAQSVHLQLGVLYSTPLVKNAVSNAPPGDQSGDIQLKTSLAPLISAALRFPMKPGTHVEVNAGMAATSLTGDDGADSWSAGNVIIGNLSADIGYTSRSLILFGGVGLTKLWSHEATLFNRGNSMKPLLEVGAATSTALGGRPFEIGARVQTHSFNTASLTENGASSGNVMRAILQVGTTLRRAKQP